MGFKSLKPEAKTQVNRFSLTVGTSGNTTYILDQTFPAGDYTIEFSNGDTTYDIYAIGTDGTNVGYTNGLTLTANAPINEIVVLGAADNEVILFENFTFSVVGGGDPIVPSSAGDVASAGAFITSVSVSSLPNTDDTTTITGGNFAADVQVFFTGQDSVELEAKSLTRNSSTELVATRPDALDSTDSPYTVKVVNPGVSEPTGSSAHLLPNSITAGANPSWVTAAAQEYDPSGAVSITLSATDADGTVSYSLQSGTLPGGLSLNGSTGEISGTPTTSDGDVSVFTIRATDEGGNFVDREFTFTAALPTIEYLVIAGGGGGGGRAGGGGGAGELVFNQQYLDIATQYSITVGAGGIGDDGISSNVTGTNGSNSSGFSYTALGGGRGGFDGHTASQLNGGSGGGQMYAIGSGPGISLASDGVGFRGGYGVDKDGETDNRGTVSGQYAAGGGGGASENGQDAPDGANGGDGGQGLYYGNIFTDSFGENGYFAGGGGGGIHDPASTSGAGGLGGGGNSGAPNGKNSGFSGIANTGGGGGGGSTDTADGGDGGNGGSGVVLLRYPADFTITIGAGLTGTTSTVGDNKVTEITAGTGNVSWS